MKKKYQNLGFFSAVNLTMGGLDLMKIYIGCHLRTTCFMNHDNGKIDTILMKFSDSMNKINVFLLCLEKNNKIIQLRLGWNGER